MGTMGCCFRAILELKWTGCMLVTLIYFIISSIFLKSIFIHLYTYKKLPWQVQMKKPIKVKCTLFQFILNVCLVL